MGETKLNGNLKTLMEITSDIMGVNMDDVVNVFNVLFTIIEPDVATKFRIVDTKIKSKKTELKLKFIKDTEIVEGEIFNVLISLVKSNHTLISNVNGEPIPNPGNKELSFNIIYDIEKIKSIYDIDSILKDKLKGVKNEKDKSPNREIE